MIFPNNSDFVVGLFQVDYEFDSQSGSLKRLIRINEKQFSSNLSILLKWSPFASEDELCKQVILYLSLYLFLCTFVIHTQMSVHE